MRRLLLITAMLFLVVLGFASTSGAIVIKTVKPGEDVFKYMTRVKGSFDQTLYRQIIGASNAFKEGDKTIGVAADTNASRENARKLLANTTIKDLSSHPLLNDNLYKFAKDSVDAAQYEKIKNWPLGKMKSFLLTASETQIKSVMYGMNCEVVGCLPKLMSNKELIAVNRKIFNPLPGTKIGAKGYLSARIQPNSPTDDPEEIQWQVLDGFAYGVGDLVLGTNPVDGTKEQTARVETALKEVVDAFQLNGKLPWCVLAHIDVQREIYNEKPELVNIMFQSLAGTDAANKTFDITVDKMVDHAKSRKGQKYGLYFETGQGSDFTNGAAEGVDMVVLESRKYGMARGLKQILAQVEPNGAYVHLNDVAGFIGPEVFRTKEQLVRCCLEDILMGKLQGITIGLDICSTLHMSVSLDDLQWCQDQIMAANPAYLMALPTRNDPMLSYLTTSYQDHVRLRSKFGYKVNDVMWDFFKRIQVIDANGKPTKHFGDPVWVYYQFQKAKGDTRTQQAIMAEGKKKYNEIQTTWLKTGNKVPLASGYGKNYWDPNPQLDKRVRELYADAKKAIWSEFSPEFVKKIPDSVQLATLSKDRENYIVHPESGEKLNPQSVATLEKLRDAWQGKVPDVQIVVSDGLNANSIMDPDHVLPYITALREELQASGLTVDKNTIVINSGRVRAGYMVGDILYGKSDPNKPRAIVHIIGERPGTGQNAFSVYIAAPKGQVWQEQKCDHNMVKVVCGISKQATKPKDAAKQTVKLLKGLMST
ncbi:ethanolamine ammonia-lyase [Geomonas sp. RF6]|uniref:ethanolamine ammonia-lyase n=1 Tax=Geomonas sp. RF6 TaxID=2897342 RepID=UPI001E4885AD|nr:ethanolamine ammonia-lyase [Geomonas sp. RF6]UFS70942.1 ethanolamine ammonia-lyase [Geomonas sp. RF6]